MNTQQSSDDSIKQALLTKIEFVSRQRNDALDLAANLATDLNLAMERNKALGNELASRDKSIATLRGDLVKAREDFDIELIALKAEAAAVSAPADASGAASA